MKINKRKYTMSRKAKAQRATAAAKKSAVRDWTVCHISRANLNWAKEKFGTANAALDYARELNNI